MASPQAFWPKVFWMLVVSVAFACVATLIGFIGYARKLSDWLDLAAWAHWFGKNLIVSLTIGVSIQLLFGLSGAWIGRERIKRLQGWQRTVYFAGVPMVAVYLSWPLGYWLAGGNVRDMWGSGNAIVGSLLLSLVITLALSMYWGARNRQIAAEARATEAQLKLLQAQIEPHFLFNTLANVVSLIDHDAPRAKQMLESFIDYLRASLTHLRRSDSSLGAELDMAAAYLALLRTRMEGRLQYDIEANDTARRAVLPPLLLQPLVENAIQHGLEPKVEGGRVSIRADVVGAQLRISVRDDGLGLAAGPAQRPSAGTGVALQNVRERLVSRYGGQASMRLTELTPGVLASIELPFETTPDPCP